MKNAEDFEQVKFMIIQYIPSEFENDSGEIIKYIQFLNINIINENKKNVNIFDYIEYCAIIKNYKENEITNNKNYLDNIKERWIISRTKERKYLNNISKFIAQIFIKNNF